MHATDEDVYERIHHARPPIPAEDDADDTSEVPQAPRALSDAAAEHAPLTEAQERFCEYYVAYNNGAQAARLSGYSDRSARTQAYRLLQQPNVRRRLLELRTDLGAENRIDRKNLMARYESIFLAARRHHNFSAAVRALKELERLAGLLEAEAAEAKVYETEPIKTAPARVGPGDTKPVEVGPPKDTGTESAYAEDARDEGGNRAAVPPECAGAEDAAGIHTGIGTNTHVFGGNALSIHPPRLVPIAGELATPTRKNLLSTSGMVGISEKAGLFNRLPDWFPGNVSNSAAINRAKSTA